MHLHECISTYLKASKHCIFVRFIIYSKDYICRFTERVFILRAYRSINEKERERENKKTICGKIKLYRLTFSPLVYRSRIFNQLATATR